MAPGLLCRTSLIPACYSPKNHLASIHHIQPRKSRTLHPSQETEMCTQEVYHGRVEVWEAMLVGTPEGDEWGGKDWAEGKVELGDSNCDWDLSRSYRTLWNWSDPSKLAWMKTRGLAFDFTHRSVMGYGLSLEKAFHLGWGSTLWGKDNSQEGIWEPSAANSPDYLGSKWLNPAVAFGWHTITSTTYLM